MQTVSVCLLAGALFVAPPHNGGGSPLAHRPSLEELGLHANLDGRPSFARYGREPRDAHEKALMWGYMSLNAVDAYQMGRIPSGYREGNPLFRSIVGERPDAIGAATLKFLGAYGILRMTDRFTPRQRKVVLYILSAIQLYVVIHNERSTGGIVF